MVNYPRRGKSGIRKFLPSWQLVTGTIVFVGVMLVAGFAAAVYFFPVPQPNDVAVAESTKVMYADGKREIGRLGDVQRTNVALSAVPDKVQYAVQAAEETVLAQTQEVDADALEEIRRLFVFADNLEKVVPSPGEGQGDRQPERSRRVGTFRGGATVGGDGLVRIIFKSMQFGFYKPTLMS